MRGLWCLLVIIGLCGLPSLTVAQQPSPPSVEDQLQMALVKIRWLEQSRMTCENSLADIWSQAAKTEQKVKEQQQKREEPKDVDSKPVP